MTTETTDHKTQRWFIKCRKCQKPWAVDLDPSVEGTYTLTVKAQWMTCPHCNYTPPAKTDARGRLVYDYSQWPSVWHKVMGKVGASGSRLFQLEERCACDGRCTNARGPSCDCSCGGVNHGSQRVVKVWRDAGAVPNQAK